MICFSTLSKKKQNVLKEYVCYKNRAVLKTAIHF
jgi:hypothetical protein